LTHHPRPPLVMQGGTTFHFVTGGIHAALAAARKAAGSGEIRLGGGVSTLRQYLQASLIDELHLALQPVLLGAGEHLMQGIDLRALGYECAEQIPGERATHMILRKRARV
ncbi:MAG: dihydrofolate reductase family protein, partial [Gemmatimonadales bacterium]